MEVVRTRIGQRRRTRAGSLLPLLLAAATAFFRTYVATDQRFAAFLDPQIAEGNPDIVYTAVTP